MWYVVLPILLLSQLIVLTLWPFIDSVATASVATVATC